MSYEKYQKHFEEEAEKAYKKYMNYTEDKLIELIKFKRWDSTYQIWRAVKNKGSEKSLFTLFEVISNMSNDYLIRYHACNALFHIAGINDEEIKKKLQRKHIQSDDLNDLKEFLSEKFNIN